MGARRRSDYAGKDGIINGHSITIVFSSDGKVGLEVGREEEGEGGEEEEEDEREEWGEEERWSNEYDHDFSINGSGKEMTVERKARW